MKSRYVKIALITWVLILIALLVLRSGDEAPGDKDASKGKNTNQAQQEQDLDALGGGNPREQEPDAGIQPDANEPKSPAEKIVDIRTVDWDDAAGVAQNAYDACALIPALDLRRYAEQRPQLAQLVSATLLADFDRLIREQSGGLPPRPPKTKVMTISLRNDDQSGARIASCTVDRWTAKGDVRHMYVDMEFSPTEPIIIQQQSGINY